MLGAPWESVRNMFGEQIADAVRNCQRLCPGELAHGVRSRYPRVKSGGDAIISLDLASAKNLLSMLWEEGQFGARVASIPDVFGDCIANAIEESDLRKWEKMNGQVSTTNCVKVRYHVELRICYDTNVAGILHSHD